LKINIKNYLYRSIAYILQYIDRYRNSINLRNARSCNDIRRIYYNFNLTLLYLRE